MARVEFTAVLEGGDAKYPNATAVTVPPDVVQALGGRGRIPIRGTVNGSPFRTTIVVMGGRHCFVVNKEMRAGAASASGGPEPRAGDRVSLIAENDDEPRTVTVPADLRAALAKEPVLAERFARMSYSHQKEHVQALEEARKPETRARRLEKTLQSLRAPAARKRPGTGRG